MKTAQEYAASSLLVTKGMVQRGEWGDVKLYYVPIWLVPVKLSGNVHAKRALVVSKGRAAKIGQQVGMKVLGGLLKEAGLGDIGKGLEDVLEENASIFEVMDAPVVARHSPMFQPDPGKYELPLERKEVFRRTGEDILNSEFSYQEAAERAKALALEKLKSRYVSIYSLDVSASPGEGELIHAPFWFVKFTMDGRSFVVVVDALTGNVVAGQRPWVPR